jgi:hypothetical protein
MANFPEFPCASDAQWLLRGSSRSFTSPFTGDIQSSDLLGEKWTVVHSYIGTTAEIAPIEGFIAALNGQSGRFEEYPRHRPTTTWLTGTVRANGAALARASQFNVDGFTGTLPAGHFIQIGAELKMITESRTGPGLLKFRPRLRNAVADNAVLITHQPRGKFRLSSDTEGQVQHTPDGIATLSIAFEEFWP